MKLRGILIMKLKDVSRYTRRFGLGPGLRIFSSFALGRYFARGSSLKTISVPGILHPVRVRARTSDVPTFDQIFVNEDYAIPTPFAPLLIIDGGANVGYASIWFANRYPGARIIAIEPEISNFEMLEANTAPYSKIETIRAGLWSRPTRLRVVESRFKHSGAWDFQVEEAGGASEGTVRSITIDEVLDRAGGDTIDILKLDIEGSERELFSGSCENWLGKVRMLIVELHDDYRPGCSEALYKAIETYDFDHHRSGENIVLTRSGRLI